MKNSKALFPAALSAALLLSLSAAPRAVSAQAAGGKAKELESLVPEKTVVFVTFRNLGAAREKWKNTALYKIWTDKEVEFAVEKLLGNFEEFKQEIEREFQKTTGVELQSALDILKGQLSFAVITLPARTEEGEKPPCMAFALDFGAQQPVVEKLIEFAKQSVGGGGDKLKTEKVQIDGTDVFAFGDDNLKFHYAFLDQTLFITMDRETMQGILSARAGKGGKSLAECEAFGRVRQATVRDGEEALFIYADFKALKDGIGEMAGIDAKELAQSIAALGVENVQSIGISVTFAEGGISDALYVHAPGEKKGLLKIISLAKTGTPHLNLVPAEAISYMGLRLDLGSIWDISMEMVKSFDEEALKEINEELAEFQKKTGVNIREDLIGALGDEISTFSSFPKGGGIIPEGVTIFSLTNPQRFEDAFRKLMEAAGLERKELAFKGRTLKYFTAKIAAPGEGPGEGPGPGEEGRGQFGSSPIPGVGMESLLLLNLTSFQNYFVEGNYLFVSNLSQSLKRVVDKLDGGDKFVSLARNPHYSRLVSRLPGSPGLVMYTDLRGIFDLVYNTLLPLGQIGEVFLRKELKVPFENAVLPRSEAVSQHLTPSVTGISTLTEGVIMSSYYTTGVTTIGLAAVGIAGAASALFMANRGGPGGLVAANETSAMATLKMICAAQEQFRATVAVDQDGNGEGEYGFLQELAGTAAFRGNKEGKKADPPFLPQYMGFCDPSGRIVRNGYFFAVYLPGESSAAASGSDVPAADAKSAARQEQAYCVYAWPIIYGNTGRRTFFMNQSGQIFYTYASLKNYGGDNAPAPEAAFDSKGLNPKNLDAVVADASLGVVSADGEMWMPGN